jgi:hypothetical protein
MDIFKDIIPVKIVPPPGRLFSEFSGGACSSCGEMGYAVTGRKSDGKIVEVIEINHKTKKRRLAFIDKDFEKFKKVNKLNIDNL